MRSQDAGAVNREGIVERLNQDVESTLAAIGFPPKREGRELLLHAVWRGDSGRPNCYVRPDSGVWIDRAMGDGGAFIELIALLLGTGNAGAAAHLESKGLLRPNEPDRAPISIPSRLDSPPPVNLPPQPNRRGEGLALLAKRWDVTVAALTWLGAVAHDGREGPEAWFPRFDEEGNPTGCWQRRPAETATFMDGSKAKASGPQIGIMGRRPDAGTVRLWIDEGEHDAALLAAIVGEDEAVAAISASATEAQLDTVAAWAAPVPEVVVIPDQDDNGLVLAERLARRIPKARIVVWDREAEASKDLAELLDPFGHDQHRQTVDRLVDNSKTADAFFASRPQTPDALPSSSCAAIAAPATVSFAHVKAAADTATVDVVRSVDLSTATATPEALSEEARQALWTQRARTGYRASDLFVPGQEPPPMRWILPGLVPQVGAVVFWGDPKIGKSSLAGQLAFAAAGGLPLFGAGQGPHFNTTKARVYIAALEDTPTDMGMRLGVLRGFFGTSCPDDLAIFHESVPSMPRLRDFMREVSGDGAPDDPVFWIIDTLGHVRPPAATRQGSAYESDYTDTRALNQMAQRHRWGVLFVHHASKGDGRTTRGIESINGTNGLLAGFHGGAWAQLASPGSKDIRLQSMMRGHAPLDLTLCRRSIDACFCIADVVDALASTNAVIASLARDRTSFTVDEYMATAGIGNRSTAKANLSKAARDGIVASDGRGNYSAGPVLGAA